MKIFLYKNIIIIKIQKNVVETGKIKQIFKYFIYNFIYRFPYIMDEQKKSFNFSVQSKTMILQRNFYAEILIFEKIFSNKHI